MTKILVVDASPLIYSVFNTQGYLSTKSGEPTGLRYGFLRSIRSYEKKTKADVVAICFDTKGPIKKAENLASYKSDRVWTESKQKMYDQVPALREMLALTKYTQLEAPGYEADDIIGHLARTKAAMGNDVTVISGDNDVCQLLSYPRVNIFRPGSSKKKTRDTYLSVDTVKEYFGVHPKHLLVFRSMVGDKSDNIDGPIKGEKAQQALATYLSANFDTDRELTLSALLSKLPDPSTLESAQADALSIIERNYVTMSLTDPTETLKVTKGARDKEALTSLFISLEFRSMMEHIKSLVGEA